MIAKGGILEQTDETADDVGDHQFQRLRLTISPMHRQ